MIYVNSIQLYFEAASGFVLVLLMMTATSTAALVPTTTSVIKYLSDVRENHVVLVFKLFLEILGEAFVPNTCNRECFLVNSLNGNVILDESCELLCDLRIVLFGSLNAYR